VLGTQTTFIKELLGVHRFGNCRLLYSHTSPNSLEQVAVFTSQKEEKKLALAAKLVDSIEISVAGLPPADRSDAGAV
jgi:hypothetical protein